MGQGEKRKVEFNKHIWGAQDEKRDDFLSELALFCNKNKETYLLCGDFNIIRFPSEKNNSNPIHRHLILSMQS
jgi:exonuclease III